jgi:hypothetical protein
VSRSFLRRFNRFDLARVIDEFDDCELGAIALTMAQFQYASVTAGPIFITISEVSEETPERGYSGGSFGAKLASPAGGLANRHVTCVKKPCRLPAQVQRTRGGTVVSKTARLARQGNGALDERPQFLRLRQSGDDAFLARVDQRSRQIAEHRMAMLTGATKFSMCL